MMMDNVFFVLTQTTWMSS